MFWSFHKPTFRINRSYLSGAEKKIIVSCNISEPNDITLDLENKRIYWVNTSNHTLESTNYDGMERQSISLPEQRFKDKYSVSYYHKEEKIVIDDGKSIYLMNKDSTNFRYINQDSKPGLIRIVQENDTLTNSKYFQL